MDGTLNLDLPAATAGAIGGVKPDGKTITAAADGTITAVAQTGPVEYRELVGYENAAQGYAVRVSDRTWLCCFNSFAMQTDGTTRLPYFYAFLRQAGSSSLTALVAQPVRHERHHPPLHRRRTDAVLVRRAGAGPACARYPAWTPPPSSSPRPEHGRHHHQRHREPYKEGALMTLVHFHLTDAEGRGLMAA